MYKISIMVCEDDKLILELLENYLSKKFEIIYFAKDGKDGLETYKKYKPQIIISDVMMPKINGIDMIREIKSIDENTECIMLSSDTNMNTLLQAIELNLVKYILKPINFKDIDLAISIAISNIEKKCKDNCRVIIDENIFWNKKDKVVFYKNEIVTLTNYETLVLDILILSANTCVNYYQIHNFVYDDKEFSQNAIASLIKRVRKKIPNINIASCYKEGYKIII
jgi:two-component system response regulator VanR